MSLAVSLNSEIRGQGFPILCLHGHPGSGGCMSVFTDHLSQNYQTIAPDLRGYGKSQVKQPFEMTDHLQDIEQLLDGLKIDKCLIIGWSLGGILALELALRNPERFTGLILVATSGYPRGNHPPISWLDNLLTGIAGMINWSWPGNQWNINFFGKRSLFRYLIQQHTPTAYKYIAKQATPAYLQTSRLATIALRQALKNRYNRLAELGNISCDCLILAGECDRHITAISSQETAANLPNSQFNCYPNTAHLFPWEIPDQVLTDIDNWIKNHPNVVDIS